MKPLSLWNLLCTPAITNLSMHAVILLIIISSENIDLKGNFSAMNYENAVWLSIKAYCLIHLPFGSSYTRIFLESYLFIKVVLGIIINTVHIVLEAKCNACVINVNYVMKKLQNEKFKRLISYYWRTLERVYLIEGSSISKDEINGSLDETFSKIMPPSIIMKRVLGSIKSTTIECGLIICDSKRHCLPSNIAR